MNNLFLRIIFGSIYVAIVVVCVLYGNLWFGGLMAIFTLLGILEAININDPQASANKKLTALVYAGIIVYLVLFENLDTFGYHYLIALVLQWVAVFFIRRNLMSQKRSSLLLDTLYIWLPLFSAAVYLTQNESGAEQLLFLFVIIWVYDSLAYASGKLLGKRPIFPKVSPKKTWEGTIGGLVFSILAAYFIQVYWLDPGLPFWLAVIAIVPAGIAGDFFESYYKRVLGVKDSGNLIPGHGGILDRIDSILFSILPYLTLIYFLSEKNMMH